MEGVIGNDFKFVLLPGQIHVPVIPAHRTGSRLLQPLVNRGLGVEDVGPPAGQDTLDIDPVFRFPCRDAVIESGRLEDENAARSVSNKKGG